MNIHVVNRNHPQLQTGLNLVQTPFGGHLVNTTVFIGHRDDLTGNH